MDRPGAGYIMEDAREGERLAEKVNAPEWVAKYLVGLIRPRDAILDVGCGPGALVAAIASRFPDSRVEGIDQGEGRVEQAQLVVGKLENARVRRGDAARLPQDDGTFDLVYSRFLLEYLPDKEAAVREMVRVCKPGGRVLLQDLDGQLLWHFPERPDLQSRTQQVLDGLARTGFDPFVGRKLFHLAHAAGLADLRVQAEAYHLIAGRIGDEDLARWKLKLDIALPAVTAALGSRQEAEALTRDFLDYLLCPDTLTYSVQFTVIGTKPA
jgi:SAM-dependent methyltransferase